MKRIIAILLVFLIMISVTACNDAEKTPSTAVSAPNSSLPDKNLPSDTPSSSEEQSTENSSSNSSVSDSSVAGPSSSPEGTGPGPEQLPVEDESIHSDHYCYAKLSERQKEYYDVMHDAVLDMQTYWVALGKADNSYKTDIAVVRNALANDHPEIFWLPSYHATALGKDSFGTSTALVYFSTSLDSDPSFLMSRSEKTIMERELNAAVKEIADKVTATEPFEIELQLHDLLCQSVEYSSNKNDPMVYTSYGALVNKSAVCEGYSRAMQLLLKAFGIEAVTITGVANNEGHMWNAVKLNGEWYHLDATWNDTKSKIVSHEYFNLTDSEILLDHTFSKDYYEFSAGELDSGQTSFNVNRPICLGTEYNYFKRSGFVLSEENLELLADYIVLNQANTIEIKFYNSTIRNKVNNNQLLYLEKINSMIQAKHPINAFYIEGISVSSITFTLYKKQFEHLTE